MRPLDPKSAQRLDLDVILCTLSRHACSTSHSDRRAVTYAIDAVFGACDRIAACATVLSVKDITLSEPVAGARVTSPQVEAISSLSHISISRSASVHSPSVNSRCPFETVHAIHPISPDASA